MEVPAILKTSSPEVPIRDAGGVGVVSIHGLREDQARAGLPRQASSLPTVLVLPGGSYTSQAEMRRGGQRTKADDSRGLLTWDACCFRCFVSNFPV